MSEISPLYMIDIHNWKKNLVNAKCYLCLHFQIQGFFSKIF